MHLIAHNIRSLHNVGAIFRSADAFGIKKLWLTGYTAAPPRPEIAKVALGSDQRVAWEKREDLDDLIKELRIQGFSIAALETGKGSIPINNFHHPAMETVLILGNEVEGLEPRILEQVDNILAIPMLGKKQSLNVSVAAGIAMFSLTQK
ncbi:TrmH family RNA methyltransferase [Patescibacteria group bacterium]|nr:TrmH family RNA methyltransferase [Patescibacteria group bacterium]MBU1705623.1 TrmH family RNA methyltransferase [Patescibacteria group bacterium]